MRFFVVACLTCLILSVAFFSAPISTPIAQAQACQPDISAASTPEVTPQQPNASIVINEVLLFPMQSQLYCTLPLAAQTPTGPWVELYNKLPQPLQLIHVSLDSGPNTNAFPLINTSIAAHSFIVVFPSTNSAFLNTSSSTLRLVLNGIPLDQVNLPTPSLKPDTSYARIPDGEALWQITPNTGQTTAPTIGQSNNIPTTIAKATSQPPKKPTATAKAKTVKKTATNNQSSNQAQQSSSSQASSAKSQMPQLQPNWKVVSLPTRIAESAPTAPATPDIANTAQHPNTADIPKKIAISLLVIALALVLWWCRKLFFNNYPVRDETSHS